ncbi:MAG: COP23 domain-containing protein [Limnospira sp. PMC 1291.21]|uniref:Circadian oscillating protein COP23 n=3 Tax=Limnospira TaxID=2596745 RepID=A0A9P1KKG0_9CYAN|nr:MULTISPECIES: COP23 domain-containing protein [Limnospira]MDC0839314.1 COP23 domain-containing protein [Limnoraphis robusta]MDY7051802.1 COP23 domain-containing protein [Limnospira fusiformis LS22]UWU45980.1 Circadian oscillating protein COP23 [Arthrospira platensis C1]EDZ96435.1 hypothetical protein AmaxDRAFT_0766 [Limnospira maxima CS-328]MDT9176524.1 COP23 domain-containing protein [Limnospira sp. PMC 1238.20]
MSKAKILLNLSMAGVTVSAAVALTSQPAVANTTFRCIPVGNGYATIAVASTGHESKPLITWNSQAFIAGGYTPQNRCEIVSQRLTSAVAQNGGLLRDLLLTTGNVNGYDVVCWVNNSSSICNPNNLLVTISPGRSAGEFLGNFLKMGANPMGEGTPGQESVRRTTVRFGELVERELEEARRQGGGHSNPGTTPDPVRPPNDPPVVF